MEKNNKNLYNKIMEEVAKQVKQSLNEIDEIAPKKVEVTGEVYLIRCDGINNKVLDKLSKELPAFDNYGSGSIRVICKTHEEVIKVISLLVNTNVLDIDNSLGQNPRIAIQKVNKNSVNDSVNEGKSDDMVRQYIQAQKIKTPRQKAKFDLITKINSGEIERTPEAIRHFMDETGLWANRSESQILMDVNLIMRKTEPDEAMEGDFITDFAYSPYNYEPGEVKDGMDAARNHAKWLIKHGLQVDIEEGRYAYKYYIHYSTKQQFDDLVKWLAWHCGLSDSPTNVINRKDRETYENYVRSGKKTIFR